MVPSHITALSVPEYRPDISWRARRYFAEGQDSPEYMSVRRTPCGDPYRTATQCGSHADVRWGHGVPGCDSIRRIRAWRAWRLPGRGSDGGREYRRKVDAATRSIAFAPDFPFFLSSRFVWLSRWALRYVCSCKECLWISFYSIALYWPNSSDSRLCNYISTSTTATACCTVSRTRTFLSSNFFRNLPHAQ